MNCRSVFAAVFATCGLGAVGCSAAQSVQSDFSTEQTCPKDRVTSQRIAEPPWAEPDPPPPPSPEIAADPARLRLYLKENPPQSYRNRRFFLASGCAHQEVYMCDVPIDVITSDGPGISYVCQHVMPPGGDGPLGLDTVMLPGTPITVAAVRVASPSARAGLTKGDVILEYDHQPGDRSDGDVDCASCAFADGARHQDQASATRSSLRDAHRALKAAMPRCA